MKRYALIVAGGSGSRMESEIPKQFLVVAGLPILIHTLRSFEEADPSIQLIVVIASSEHETWRQLVARYQCKIPFWLVAGGETRSDSVRNGLAMIPDNEESLVAIHDGVRPCVAISTILESYEVATQKGSAVAVVALKDSIREYDEHTSITRARENYCLVQTPQTFQTQLIKAAYQVLKKITMTDDAGVAEQAGIMIHLIKGDYRNIKATTPEDLKVLEVFLTS
jgi:2-C-methyl-D-erythritol 4-phosphate cytidylyltransferase